MAFHFKTHSKAKIHPFAKRSGLLEMFFNKIPNLAKSVILLIAPIAAKAS
ncbi:hypothetical protein SPBRAN_706 [uncultured Candidatus Thioglobus sp.]|nr:hypothetical protein SPBRAN_706 [uncultured Candidatus Thioglobus sp.]